MATTVKTITATGSTNWICPPGVFLLQVELWGGGGSGGPATGTASGGGGGAGGQYAIKQVDVVPGTTYAVSVAAAATANTTNVVNGNDTTFASTTVVAKGGAGGAKSTGATSNGGTGATTNGVGDTVYAGGSGGNGVSSTQSGGGGSGAGSTGTGNSGSGATAGTAKANNGGAGGTGVTVANTNNAGSTYGGGGSGGLSNSATDRAGGNGAQGLAVLTFTTPEASKLRDNFNDNSFNTTLYTRSNATQVTETGGVLQIATTTTAVYYSATTIDFYDLTSNAVWLQLVNGGNQALTSLEVVPINLVKDASNLVQWYLNAGTLKVFKKVGGVTTAVGANLTYNSTTHKWLRIRESAGTVYFDYSSDGYTWTNHTSELVSNLFAMTNLQYELSAGCFAIEGSTTTVQVDNLNCLPSMLPYSKMRRNILTRR